MAQDLFSKWDKAIDTEGLAKDVEDQYNKGLLLVPKEEPAFKQIAMTNCETLRLRNGMD